MAATYPVADRGNDWALHVDLSAVTITNEQFYRLCIDNPELRIELTAQGELILMSPTGAKTGHRNSELNYQLVDWAKKDGKGLTFDSSTVFSLPNGAKRSPDASWILKKRWEALNEDEQNKIAPVCPDFVVELRSPSDRVETLRDKMREYVDNGSKLGWLLDPFDKCAYIYRPGKEVERLDNPERLEGEDVVDGLVVDLKEIL
jgi:Uma2 family endonuclease